VSLLETTFESFNFHGDVARNEPTLSQGTRGRKRRDGRSSPTISRKPTGRSAGAADTNGINNVYIGAGIVGVAGESNNCYIASIFGSNTASGSPVLIDSNNKLGTIILQGIYKESIKSMGTASESLFSLKPVSFRYKKEIDPTGTSQLGLVAEDVEKVNPDLVVRDKEGKPYSVRYDQVDAMLLNEFLKAHRKLEEQGAMIARQQKQIDALTAGL